MPAPTTDPLPPDRFCQDARALAQQAPALVPLWGFDPGQLADDGALVVAVLATTLNDAPAREALTRLATPLFAPGTPGFALLREDIRVTALRDQDPGGPVASLLHANGLQNLLAYRLTSALWQAGAEALALALKTRFLRALGADIMPQARIGRRVWIDHGLGIVIGQTAVIEEDVSLWHGVTLGTNMVDRGPARHPRIRAGAIIGAGAKLIGPVEIGAGAVVAAGTNVVEDVPPGALAVGARARILPGRARSAEELGILIGELP